MRTWEGKPYGLDLLIPARMEDKDGELSVDDLRDRVPPEHRKYIADLLASHDIDTNDLWTGAHAHDYTDNMRATGAARLLDVAFSHPIKLFVNALGVPPRGIIERARAQGIAVGALTGAREHALKHAQAGVDILVVAGTEAGGHCGEVSTLVLVPEVIDAVAGFGDIHILAAGGIATGRQMAACMAMGAAGVWTGSVWLTTAEAETTPTVKQKMLMATSRNTVRSRSRTGKPTRQLQSSWTDAWLCDEAARPVTDAVAGHDQPACDGQDRQARRARS